MADGRSMRERMLAGDPYVFDESLAEDTRRCRLLLRTINDATPDQDDERDDALRELLGSFGAGSNIQPPFRCEYGYQIHVGERVFANFGLVCLDVARITIGDDTRIGPGVQLLTPTHPLEPDARREAGRAPSRSPSDAASGSAALSSSPRRHDRRRQGGRRRVRGHARPTGRGGRGRQPGAGGAVVVGLIPTTNWPTNDASRSGSASFVGQFVRGLRSVASYLSISRAGPPAAAGTGREARPRGR